MRWAMLALGLTIAASGAHAYPVGEDGALWPFWGQGVLSAGGPEHEITGFLRFERPFESSLSAYMDGNVASYIAGFSRYTAVQYGRDGSPDRVFSYVMADENSLGTASILHPLSAEWGYGLYELRLIDAEATAFGGLSPSIMPPPNAPDTSLFEVREINLWQYRCSIGPVPCTNTGIPELLFTISIDRIPEPGAAVSIAFAMAALLAWRRLNRTRGLMRAG